MVFTQNAPTGCSGVLINLSLVFSKSLSALIRLHFLQQATTLLQMCSPPFDFGIM